MVKPEGAPEEEEATTAAPTTTEPTTTTTDSTTTQFTAKSTAIKAAEAAASAPKAKPVKAQGYAYLFKYVLVGDCGAGKTALLQRFAKDDFTEAHNYTIGVDFAIKTVDLPNGDEVKLQMWDTAGQERFRTITNSYYRGAHAVVIVYDMSDEESFDNVARWFDEVQRYCNDDTLCIVVGTKKDKVDGADTTAYGADKLRQMLKEKEMMKGGDDGGSTIEEVGVLGVYEASAKSGEGVAEAFQGLTDKLVANKLDERNPLRMGRHNKNRNKGHDIIHLVDLGKKPKSRCC